MLDIWHYVAVEASEDIADDLIRRIVERAARVGRLPQSGRSRDDIKLGTRSVLLDPYVIFYRIDASGVQILAVLHQRRNLAAAMAKRG